MFDIQPVPAHLNKFSEAVIGAAIEVHRALGPGFLEAAYEAALVMELELRRIPFQRQVQIPVIYKGREVSTYRIDLVCYGKLVVELKTVEAIHRVHRAQVIAYLKAGNYPLGLVLNFYAPVLKDGLARVFWRAPEEV